MNYEKLPINKLLDNLSDFCDAVKDFENAKEYQVYNSKPFRSKETINQIYNIEKTDRSKQSDDFSFKGNK